MLWVFGDSFSISREQLRDKPEFMIWPEIVSHNLNLENYYNYAEWGVSNEYIYHQYHIHSAEIKPGDYIVIQLTSIDRQWFFKDIPTKGNYYSKGIQEGLSKEQYEAIKMYITYLQRDELDIQRYHLLHLALERLKHIMNYSRILILPGFTPIPNCKGTLVNVSEDEFVSKNNMQKYYDNNNGIDPRSNHLSKNNHKILASKITRYFTHGTPIDLTTDFEKSFI